MFSTVEKYADGKAREYTLLKESDTPIVRHIKIKAAANPHDPNWDEYFEFRWGKKMLKSIQGRAKMYRVWRQQDGLCSVCHKPVTKDTPWHSRHIVKLAHGERARQSILRSTICIAPEISSSPMLKRYHRVLDRAFVEA